MSVLHQLSSIIQYYIDFRMRHNSYCPCVHTVAEHAQAGAYSMMSMLHDKAVVKKEQFWDVVGGDKYAINNLLDEKYDPRPIDDILQETHSLLGQELPYCVLRRNCEHFVTELRYGKPESRQVRAQTFLCFRSNIFMESRTK